MTVKTRPKGYVKKSGKKWYCITWDNVQRKQLTKSFATQEEAEAYRLLATTALPTAKGKVSVETLLRTVAPVAKVEPTTHMTVGDFLREWDAKYVSGLSSAKTRQNFKGAIDRHLIPALGSINLRKLSPLSVQGFVSDQLKAHSPATVKTYYSILRAALNDACDWGLLDKNPAQSIKVSVPRRRFEPWTDEQISLFLGNVKRETSPCKLCNKRHSRWYALFLALVSTGMRPGEALAIKWADVSLTKRQLTIRGTLTRTDDGGCEIEDPKTASATRTIPLPDALTQALRDLREHQKAVEAKTGIKHELVFCQDNGKALWLHNLSQKMFRRYFKISDEASLPAIRLYDLRHCYASQFLQAGGNIRRLSEYLGHADPAFTLRTYAHLIPVQEDATVMALERLWRASPAPEPATT